MRPTTDGRDTRNARGRATVRNIEREAVRLALEHGPAALTVDQICDAVGISQRNFFNHFDSKDDALLGWELPHLNQKRINAYLADVSVGVLTGALTLVELPSELEEEPELVRARFQVIANAPWLLPRHMARMLPLVDEVTPIVESKLRTLAGPDIGDTQLRNAAITITRIAASLMLPVPPLDPAAAAAVPSDPLPSPGPTSHAFEDLRWIWSQLI